MLFSLSYRITIASQYGVVVLPLQIVSLWARQKINLSQNLIFALQKVLCIENCLEQYSFIIIYSHSIMWILCVAKQTLGNASIYHVHKLRHGFFGYI